MTAPVMCEPIDARMAQWRDGLLSDCEMLEYIALAQYEVICSMKAAEIIKAELRMKRIGVPPFKATP